MVDVVGLVLSIGQAVKLLYDYGSSVKDSQPEIVTLNSELLTLKAVLNDISTKEESLIKTDHFLDTLRSGYVIINELLTKLKKPPGKVAQAWKSLKWPLIREDVAKLQVRLRDVKESLMLSLMTDSSTMTYDMQQEVKDFHLEYKSQQAHQEQAAKDEMLDDLRRWLMGLVDQRQKHRSIIKIRHPATGQWFLQSDDFQQWLNDESHDTPQVLCLVGKSGAGKTSLMSSAVNAAQVRAKRKAGVATEELGYCYVSFTEPISQDPINVACALLSHLSHSFPETLQGLRQNDEVTLEELESRIIQGANEATGTIHLFVDAVNECRESDPVLESLLRIIDAAPSVRLLVTEIIQDNLIAARSRATPPRARFVQMQPIDEDIRLYIGAKIKDYKNLRELDDALKQEIKDVLGKKSEGMFRYAHVQLDYLGAQANGKLVQKALYGLHRDIYESYSIILERIPNDDKQIAREALTWLCFVYRPFGLEQLVEVSAFEASEETLDPRGRMTDPTELLRWFQGLVSYWSPTDSTITLSHSSVRTFLLSEQIKDSGAASFSLNQADADRLMMRKCLTYMMFKDFSGGYQDKFGWIALQLHWPLLKYAATEWATHARQLGENIDPEDEKLALSFFSTWHLPRHGNFGFWVQCLNRQSNVRIAQLTQPLYYAASYGLRRIASSWLAQEGNVDLEAAGGRFLSKASRIACFRGYYHIAQDLRLKGAALPYGSYRKPDICTQHPGIASDDHSSNGLQEQTEALEGSESTKSVQTMCVRVVERFEGCHCIHFEHPVTHRHGDGDPLLEELSVHVAMECPDHPGTGTKSKKSAWAGWRAGTWQGETQNTNA